ncbi:Hsp70 family protein [Dactylosporangium sp. NPDC051541]|uniref:Hsp70 family protein n=1 Tax=Dactylosporangium sp. NPDC051541 TaxID=3363977 RepID=UPI0037977F2A
MGEYRLGVDLGTSTTVAMLRGPDGRVLPLLFDGSPLLSSAVLFGTDGLLHTGRDAEHLAHAAPERFEPNPKRRIDDTGVLLGGAEIPVGTLLTATLRRVAAEAARVAGAVPPVTLTHPVGWGPRRRWALSAAAAAAGLRQVDTVPEPIAAAAAFATPVPDGGLLLVYDLGAGTCDLTLLRRTHGGYTTVASDGLDNVGGLDIDAAVVAHLQGLHAELRPTRALWNEVRSAKEMLSRASSTIVHLPDLGLDVPLGREELERLARPILEPTVERAQRLVGGQPVTVFPIGGGSRIPLVATLLHTALGAAPIVLENPELVVADGAAHLSLDPAPPARPIPAAAAAPAPAAARPARQWGAWAGVALFAVLAATGIVLLVTRDRSPGGTAAPGATASATATPTRRPPSFDQQKIPEHLCRFIDVSAYTATHAVVADSQQEETEPKSTGDTATASCSLDLAEKDKAAGERSTKYSVFSFVTMWDDAHDAAGYQRYLTASPAVGTLQQKLAGLGDDAMLIARPQAQSSVYDLRVIVQDANLSLEVTFRAIRSDNSPFTAQDQQQFQTGAAAVARSSLPKIEAAL